MGQRHDWRLRAGLPRFPCSDARETSRDDDRVSRVAYGLLLIGRALWLGDPLSIPLHQLQNGALLIFAFFMISDPKTTPNTARWPNRFGALVAASLTPSSSFFMNPTGRFSR